MMKQHYHCNACGKQVDDAGVASEFSGSWSNQTTVAAGGEHVWHSCSFECAAKHLRDVAAGVEKRGAELRAQREAYARSLSGSRDPLVK